MRQRDEMLSEEMTSIVLQELSARWDAVPAGILQTIETHQAELLPVLRSHAFEAIKLVEKGEKVDPRFFARIAIILGAHGFPPAHTVLDRALRLEDQEWLGDFTDDVLPRLLARTCNGHFEVLRGIARDHSVATSGRANAFSAMVIHALHFPEKRAELITIARELLDGNGTTEEDLEARALFANALLELREKALSDDIKRNADNFVLVKREEVDGILASPPFARPELSFSVDAHALLGEWGLDEAWRTERAPDEDDRMIAALDQRSSTSPGQKKKQKDKRRAQKAARKKNRRK